MKIISRSEALALGLKRYFTGKPCRQGHVAERYAAGGGCVACDRASRRVENMTPERAEKENARKRAWEEANRDKVLASRRVENMTPERAEKALARQRAWCEANRDKLSERKRAYYEANREKALARRRAWREANRDKDCASQRAWREANRDKKNARHATRKAMKLKATPAWADLVAITAVYAEADRLTRETGIPHHVDHIVPLQSPLVCGLHVHWNLRPLPASENIRKGNKLLEECHA